MSDVDEFLEHFGIKGMHWGSRKARASVTMTREGRSAKIFYNPDKAKLKVDEHGSLHVHTTDKREARRVDRQVKAAQPKLMTNKELQDRITRMNLEKQYGQIAGTGSSINGKGIAFKMLKGSGNLGSNVAKQVVQQRLAKAINDQIDAAFKKK